MNNTKHDAGDNPKVMESPFKALALRHLNCVSGWLAVRVACGWDEVCPNGRFSTWSPLNRRQLGSDGAQSE